MLIHQQQQAITKEFQKWRQGAGQHQLFSELEARLWKSEGVGGVCSRKRLKCIWRQETCLLQSVSEMFGPCPENNVIMDIESGKKIVMTRQGGSFVTEANFV